MATETQDQILTNALAPKKAAGDSGSAEQHSIPDQIVADQYAASKNVASSRRLGIRIAKIVAPGAV